MIDDRYVLKSLTSQESADESSVKGHWSPTKIPKCGIHLIYISSPMSDLPNNIQLSFR